MLKGIDPLLSPDLLKVLAEMGHGDAIVIADANFTAQSLSRHPSGARPVLHLPGISVERCARAVLSLLPLDASVAQPITCMQVCGTPEGYLSAQQRSVVAMLEAEGHALPAQCEAVERFAFYDRVRAAQAIVLTGELQPYGNFIFQKGVLGEALVP
ncbi:RbsD/FucU domain-containing protein [Curvibacter sp. HBC61]|uniref:RbsD/FucU domain-containing protein n=1 Tax=Curvibacter cyanobacteriorum TaxID=3026422 RepID=A0ABT5MW22_9BURK|nr:RbsD/FucU domain-containing protein [Curvibacter sp. HBC61]MDD0838037.1 RbsD/FucU domain-containing protein [Curvibacter sp. HBC61]